MDVIDTELRLRCVEAAASNAGSNPNVIQQARLFYEFVTEGQEEPVEGDITDAISNVTPPDTPFAKATKKGSKK